MCCSTEPLVCPARGVVAAAKSARVGPIFGFIPDPLAYGVSAAARGLEGLAGFSRLALRTGSVWFSAGVAGGG